MDNNFALAELEKARQKIILEKERAVLKFNKAISDLETAMESISGKKIWELNKQELYDDEHPDYIRQSEEEI